MPKKLKSLSQNVWRLAASWVSPSPFVREGDGAVMDLISARGHSVGGVWGGVVDSGYSEMIGEEAPLVGAGKPLDCEDRWTTDSEDNALYGDHWHWN